MDKRIFYHSKSLYPHTESSDETPHNPGVRLPKVDVPTFNGDILNWRTFWKQFCIVIHDRTHLADAERLAYLRHALKEGTAKGTIDGLSRSGAPLF